jgi:hypothetical protein
MVGGLLYEVVGLAQTSTRLVCYIVRSFVREQRLMSMVVSEDKGMVWIRAEGEDQELTSEEFAAAA